MINKNLVVIVFVCLGLLGCSGQKWHDVHSSEHRFSVRMPGEPKERYFPQQAEVGIFDNYMFYIPADPKSSMTDKKAVGYAVLATKFPSNYHPTDEGWKDMDEFLLSGMASYASKNQGVLISHQWIQNGLYRGVEGRIVWEGGSYEQHREFWANGYRYYLSVLVPEGAVLPPEAVEFFDSFKILD